MKYKAIIQYKGTNYQGFAKQNKEPTIEYAIENAIATLLKKVPKISVAGRTDAGVHALGQVISFEGSPYKDLGQMRYRLNALLPADIKISEVVTVDNNFDARFSARARQYVYYILNRRYTSVIHDDFYFHHFNLDINKMISASKYLIGKQNYRSFSAPATHRNSFVRNIMIMKVEQKSDFFDVVDKDMVKITVKADSFLYHMVRNIVGTLVKVGMGNMSSNKIRAILASEDRRKAGATAPAKGLFLEKVFY